MALSRPWRVAERPSTRKASGTSRPSRRSRRGGGAFQAGGCRGARRWCRLTEATWVMQWRMPDWWSEVGFGRGAAAGDLVDEFELVAELGPPPSRARARVRRGRPRLRAAGGGWRRCCPCGSATGAHRGRRTFEQHHGRCCFARPALGRRWSGRAGGDEDALDLVGRDVHRAFRRHV